jgi:Mor family transcriptional regulator
LTEPTSLTPGQSEDAAVQLEHDFTSIVREEIGMHEGMAGVFAAALVRGLRRRLGGQDIYIPAPDRSVRDASIRRDFNGSNVDELMRRHGLSRTRIYEIVGQRPPRPAAAKNPESPLKTGLTNG